MWAVRCKVVGVRNPFRLTASSPTPGDRVDAALVGVTRPDLSAAAVVPHQVGIQSPFHEVDHLRSVVWADLQGREAQVLTRQTAMGIPAVARQRHLLAGTGAKAPLRQVDAQGTPTPDQPDWLTTGYGHMSAWHRMLWTLDDLLFHPFSVWWAERDTSGLVVGGVERVPTERWETDEVDRLLVDGQLVDEAEVIVIPGPHEGILNFGSTTLLRTLDNLESAARAARNPSAYLELHYTGDEPLTPEQKTELLNSWAKARRGEFGGVAFTGRNVEVREHGSHEAALLIDGRNADAVDVSRLVSSPAAMADATSAGASLTYETTEGRNGQFLDYGASLYMDAVAARLSMDDVVGPGLRVAFDTTGLTSATRPATGTGVQE